MSDYVSRQYLLDEYDRQHQGPPGGARKIIAEAPAADVVPAVIGKWERCGVITLKCNVCGYVIHDGREKECKFCPNCGAKMEMDTR